MNSWLWLWGDASPLPTRPLRTSHASLSGRVSAQDSGPEPLTPGELYSVSSHLLLPWKDNKSALATCQHALFCKKHVRHVTLCGGPTPPRTCLVLTTCRWAASVLFASECLRTLPDSYVQGPTAPLHTSLRACKPKPASAQNECPAAPTRCSLTCPRSS